MMRPPAVVASTALYKQWLVKYTSDGLSKSTLVDLLWLFRERGRVPCARRAASAGYLAVAARPATLGQRDRRAVRYHPAGCVPASEGAQGRGTGGRPPAGPAASLHGAPGRAGRAARFP